MLKAKQIMSSQVITVNPQTSVKKLAKLLTIHQISGVPVVDEAGILVGVVTESDLIDQSKKIHIPTVITILDSFFFLENPDKMETEMRKIAATLVGDICTNQPVTVTEETTLDEIATLMAEKNIHTLPVMQDEKLVGVIGKKDIIQTLVGD